MKYVTENGPTQNHVAEKSDPGDKLETVVTIRPAYCSDIRTKPEERPRQPNLGLISDKLDLRRAWWA